jgi:hypothetical protein
MITATAALDTLQRQIDDTDGELYSRDRLLDFLQDGYDRLCRETESLFDMEMYDTAPRAANYTRDFERQFIEGPIYGKFNATREADAQFMEGGAEISNHTRASDQAYMDSDGDQQPTVSGLRELPEGYASVDRVTHDWLRLDPEHDRYNKATRISYQTLVGGVYLYQMDQDGWQNIRLVNVPAPVPDTETYLNNPNSATRDYHGVIRAWTDDSLGYENEPTIGSWGITRSIPQHFVSGSQFGGMRRLVTDGHKTRVEYYRLGKPLDKHSFEIPDRMVKYVQWWALHRVYGTPGEGENQKLAEHYKMRFSMGIDRLKTRINSVMRERTIQMGSKRTSNRDAYLEHFPADFGYSRPFRR